LGAHEHLGLDGKSTVSVKARPDLFEMPLFPPKRWSRNVRQIDRVDLGINHPALLQGRLRVIQRPLCPCFKLT